MAGFRWWWMALLLLQCWRSAGGCMCTLEHPQTQYCRADFVIVATPRRVVARDAYTDAYKLDIRKVFKMSDKASVALKARRLIGPNFKSSCRKSLKLNQTYLITGVVTSLQARVNMCNFIVPWEDVTPRQKKGFRTMYKQGCLCTICHEHVCTEDEKHSCIVENLSGDNCHSSHGICLSNKDGMCHWARVPRLLECLRQNELQHITSN